MNNSDILNRILIDWGSDNDSDSIINVNPKDVLNDRDLYTIMNNPTFKECTAFFKECCIMYTDIIQYILKNVISKNSNLTSSELSYYVEFILGDPGRLGFFNSGKPEGDNHFPDDSFVLSLDDIRLNDGEFSSDQEKYIKEFITNFNKCPIIRIILHKNIKGFEFFEDFFKEKLNYKYLTEKLPNNITNHIFLSLNDNGNYIIDIDAGTGNNSVGLYGFPESKWITRNINKKELLNRCKSFLKVFYEDIIYKLEQDFC